jgi:hypothetical protein
VHFQSSARDRFKRDGFHIIIAFVSLAIWITFTEFTIPGSRFASVSGTIWQFRQVPLSLTVPVVFQCFMII